MTSTKSFSNSFFKLFCAELNQKKGVVLLTLLSSCGVLALSMMYYYGNLLSRLFATAMGSETQLMGNWIVGLGLENLTERLCSNSAVSMAVLTVIFFLFTNNVFNYLYKKQKVDFYHAIPVSRRSMLLIRYWMGIGIIVVSYVLNFGALALTKGLAETKMVGTFDLQYLFFFLLQSMIVVICFFTFYVVAAVCAGNSVQYVMIAISLGLSGKLIDMILHYPVDRMIGYTANTSWLAYVFPNYKEVDLLLGVAINWWTVLSLLVVSICLLLIGLHFYGKRKSETAEQLISNPVIIVGSVFVLQMIAFVLIVSGIRDTNQWLTAAAGIAACVGVGVVVQLILTRGQQKYWKQFIVQSCIAGVIGVGIILFTTTGGLGYEKRIPAIEKVDHVTVIAGQNNQREQYGVFLTLLSPVNNYSVYGAEQAVLRETETIELVRQLHQAEIDLAKDDALVTISSINDIKIMYHLKNGTTVVRFLPSAIYTKELEASLPKNELFNEWEKYFYHPEYNKANKAQQPLFNSQEYLLQASGASLNDVENNIVQIAGMGYFDDINESADINQLMRALRSDALTPANNPSKSTTAGISPEYNSIQFMIYTFSSNITKEEKDAFLELPQNKREEALWLYEQNNKLVRRTITIPISYTHVIDALSELFTISKGEVTARFQEDKNGETFDENKTELDGVQEAPIKKDETVRENR